MSLSVRVSTAAGSTTSSTTTTGVIAGGLEKINAGLTIAITPKVLRDGKIKLKLNINNSAVAPGASIDGLPGISTNAVTTEMVVRTGQTAAIAGMYKFLTDNSDSGVPGAMNVPIFGWLFKSNSKSNQRSEVMAFITPAILESPNEKSINTSPAKAESIPLQSSR